MKVLVTMSRDHDSYGFLMSAGVRYVDSKGN